MEKVNSTMLIGEFFREAGVLWAALGVLEIVIEYRFRGSNITVVALLLWVLGCLAAGGLLAFVGIRMQLAGQRRRTERDE